MATPPGAEIERVFREEYGRAVAVLVRLVGDIDVAEEAVQDAFTAAVQRWPVEGLPPSPAGWIITTARNRAIDRLRREARRDDLYAHAAALHERDEPLDLNGYHLYHAIRADLLRRLGRDAEAALAYEAAIACTGNAAEREHLELGRRALRR